MMKRHFPFIDFKQLNKMTQYDIRKLSPSNSLIDRRKECCIRISQLNCICFATVRQSPNSFVNETKRAIQDLNFKCIFNVAMSLTVAAMLAMTTLAKTSGNKRETKIAIKLLI